MKTITLQVLEGLERGQTYEELLSPVSIGREEENTIRLNDERVSRFHAKLQEDGGRTILTDLESTNGTRVNGRSVQMRVLKPGDQISIGRCLLLFGSNDEIRARIEKDKPAERKPSDNDDHALNDSHVANETFKIGASFSEGLPEIPQSLGAGQRADLADLIGDIHDELRILANSVQEIANPGPELPDMRVPGAAWQRLLQLEMNLAVTLRKIAEPDLVAKDTSAGSHEPDEDG